MATEIERKFLLLDERWREHVTRSQSMRQGYMPTDKSCSVRIRLSGDKAYLNIKSGTLAISRQEYEYAIPMADGEALLNNLCRKAQVEKVRHYVEYAGHTWEIDVFSGDNAGLVVAEIELNDPDETFVRPPWLGAEVSEDRRYYNVCLIDHPFKDW